MNILLDELPEAIRIDGREYPINSDFRTGIAITLAYEDPDLTTIEKHRVLLERLYKEQPTNLREAIEKGLKFIDGGLEAQAGSQGAPGARYYSLKKDAPLIYAAFQQTHGIDLQREQGMHWYRFISLFMDLGAETAFSSLVNLRKRVKTGKATKEEKAAARELGDLFTIPDQDTRSLEEKIAADEFMRLLKGHE